MSDPEHAGEYGGLLAKIGISTQEEWTYRQLLRHGSATIQELSESLGLGCERMRTVVRSLQRKGLAVPLLESNSSFMPIAPELAIGALIQRRQATLERIRGVVPLFCHDIGSSKQHQGEKKIVEVVTGQAACSRTFQQLQQSTRRELRCLIRKPSMLFSSGPIDAVRQKTPLREVRYQSVFDHDLLQAEGSMEYVQAYSPSGEQARISQCIPFELMISDRQFAVMPLLAESADGPLLLVRSCALLDGLNILFDGIWRKATPVEYAANNHPAAGNGSGPAADGIDVLIPLLAAGFNDKAIAHELGISMRTLLRRIAELLTTFEARTRFQAGWLAALRKCSICSRTHP